MSRRGHKFSCNERIILTLHDYTQRYVLTESTETFAQLYVGDFSNVKSILRNKMDADYPEESTDEQKKELEDREKKLAGLLEQLRDVAFPERKDKDPYQIRDEKVDNYARVAWDIYQVINEVAHGYRPCVRSSKSSSLPVAFKGNDNWKDILHRIRGDLEAIADGTTKSSSKDTLPDNVKELARKAAEVLSPCLCNTES